MIICWPTAGGRIHASQGTHLYLDQSPASRKVKLWSDGDTIRRRLLLIEMYRCVLTPMNGKICPARVHTAIRKMGNLIYYDLFWIDCLQIAPSMAWQFIQADHHHTERWRRMHFFALAIFILEFIRHISSLSVGNHLHWLIDESHLSHSEMLARKTGRVKWEGEWMEMMMRRQNRKICKDAVY